MTYNVTLFGLKFNINPVAFKIPIGNGWSVYWYGIIIALGFLSAIIYAYFNAKKSGIDIDRMLDVILVTTPVSILCARAYYVIFDGEKLSGIGDFFGFDNGTGFTGLAIYGGVIGAFACGALMCKLRKINILQMFDLAAVGFILAQGIGRWGNFFNQEAYGTVTGSSWWGMTSNRISAEMGTSELVHPCFLYESVWCIIGFFVLNYIINHKKFNGQVVLSYCIWYGFERGFLELIRTDSLMLGPVRVSSALSFIICIAGIIITVFVLKKQKEEIKQNEYEKMFAYAYEGETEASDNSEITDENMEDKNFVEVKDEIADDGIN